MSKKTRIVPQRRPTKRQLSRWQKEKQVQRFILAGGAFAILLVLAIPIFGFAREYAFKGQESVARVEKSVFHLSDYAQILGLRYYQMDSQLDNLQQAIGQANAQKSGGQSGDQTGNQGGDPLQANLQSLQQARLSLPYQILEDWISEQLVRQEASRQGLTVTP
ncbi:MAG: hypothetical protein Q8P59_04670, partial [Dehalococcoidia bacterium]|nr:hypothetical protein [Dehalococcoidia bacterium]